MTDKKYIRNGKSVYTDYLGTKISWFKDNELHREDGPAIILCHSTDPNKVDENDWWLREWHKEGKMHREDGPAEELKEAGRPTEYGWYLNGVSFTQEDFEKQMNKNNIAKKVQELRETTQENPLTPKAPK